MYFCFIKSKWRGTAGMTLDFKENGLFFQKWAKPTRQGSHLLICYGSFAFKVLLKSFWPIHIDEFFKSPYKMKSNDTKFTMIEKAILILLMICFSDWWRHLLFSLIRKTLDNQYFRKILGNKTLCKQNIFLKKVQSYKQKYTIIIFS